MAPSPTVIRFAWVLCGAPKRRPRTERNPPTFGGPRRTAPKRVLKAAKKSIDAGLAPDAALRALTLTAAEIFGVADRLGSIENGKIANLVVTDGDLFEEKTKIKMVFVDGRRFEVREPEK